MHYGVTDSTLQEVLKNSSQALNQLNRSRIKRTPAIIRHLSSRVRDPRYRLYASGKSEQGAVSLNYNQSAVPSASYSARAAAAMEGPPLSPAAYSVRSSEAAQLLPPPSPSAASVEPVVTLESSPSKKLPQAPPQVYQPPSMPMAPPRPAQLPAPPAAYRPVQGPRPSGGQSSIESPSSPSGNNALYLNAPQFGPQHGPPMGPMPSGHVKRESSGYVPKTTGF